MPLKNPVKILQDIRTIREDLDKNGMNLPPSLAGIYGEMLAYQVMRKYFKPKGYEVRLGAGQSKADIQLVKNGKIINVEIKTSRRKDEWFGTGYGFAINIKKCGDHPKAMFKHLKRGKLQGDFCYFDYIVTITLSDDLKKYSFYVFPQSFLVNNEKWLRNRSKRFNNGTHRIVFAEKPSKTDELTLFDRQLVKNRVKFKNAWNLIKSPN